MINEVQQALMNKVAEALNSQFPAVIEDTCNTSDIPTITVTASLIHEVIKYLKEEPALNFSFLTTLCGTHYPQQQKPFGLVYHLHNLETNERLRIKTWLEKETPNIASICDLFSAANWMEREAYDFYGIVFNGHPNLIRILNVEYLDYFPMRKEYPLEDPTREDKEDKFFGR